MRNLTTLVALLASVITAAAATTPPHGNVVDANTVVELLTTKPQGLTTTYIVKGLSTVGDPLGGAFYYDSASVQATNALSVFAWGTGRLSRILGVGATNVFDTIIVTNGLIDLNLTPGFLPYADTQHTLTDSPLQRTDATSFQAGNATLTNSLIVTGTHTNSASNLQLTNWLQMMNVTGGQAAVFDAGGRLTNGIAPGVTTINPSDNYLPVRSSATTFADSGLYRVGVTNVATDGQIIFGPGTTNVLYRSGPDAIYTNSGIPSFIVKNGSGVAASIGLDVSSHGFIRSSSSKLQLEWLSGGGTIQLTSSEIIPPNKNSQSIGDRYLTFRDVALERNLQVVGFSDNTDTNYSILNVSHSGTNGAVVLDSQSAGTVGAPRPFQFKLGSTNALNISRQPSATLLSSDDELILSPGNSYEIRFRTGGSDKFEFDQNGNLLSLAASVNNIGVDSNGLFNAPRTIAAHNFLVIHNAHTPASSSETNFVGAITWDASFLYVWTDTNVNKRVALSSW